MTLSKWRTGFRGLLAALALSLGMPGASLAETIVATWNIRNLGWENGKDFAELARIAERFDLFAVQEVMSERGIQDLVVALETSSGLKWQYLVSHATGRGTYKEHYAFVFREGKVEWVDGAVVYIDDRDVFEREPFAARFRTYDGIEFVMTSVHLIYGQTVEGRQREAGALSAYREWLDRMFPGTPVFVAGDFNLPPSDDAWEHLGRRAWPLIQVGGTTLGMQNGKYANLYDNIWAPSGIDLPVSGYGVLDYPKEVLGWSHEHARERISDHAPVWMILDADAPPIRFQPWTSEVAQVAMPGIDPIADTPVIANRNSGIYHLPSCPGYSTVSARNRIDYADPEDAEVHGYRRAKNCPVF